MKDAYIVYCLCDPFGKVFYIGTTSRTAKRRMIEHRSRAKKGENLGVYKLWRAFKEEPTLKILAQGLSEFEGYLLERKLIALYGRRDKNLGNLTNQSDGGKGSEGFIASDSFRKFRKGIMKGSQINKGRKRPDMVSKFSKEVLVEFIDKNTEQVYSSQREAANDLGIHYDTINAKLKGRYKNTGTKTEKGLVIFHYN